MWLRLLVSNWIHSTGKQKLYEAFSEAVQARGTARPSSDGTAATGNDDNQPAAEPPPPCDVALIFALGIEAGGIVDRLQDKVMSRYENCVEHSGKFGNRQVVVTESGVGRKLASDVATDVIRCHKPTWVISAGFAGALQDGVRRGHIVMAETVVDETGSELETGLRLDPKTLAAQPWLHTGRLLTVNQVVRSEEEKRQFGEKYQAVACDMETAAVAEVCRQHKTRFLSVRVISDAVDERLPPEIESLLGQKSLAGKLGAAAGAIFNRPSSVKDMWNLREEAIKASDRLAKFLEGTVAQLK